MNPAETVVGQVQVDRRSEVFELLGKGQRQPCKTFDERAGRPILALNVRSAYRPLARHAPYAPALDSYACGDSRASSRFLMIRFSPWFETRQFPRLMLSAYPYLRLAS